jgi:lysophospholipase L1-like esterase
MEFRHPTRSLGLRLHLLQPLLALALQAGGPTPSPPQPVKSRPEPGGIFLLGDSTIAPRGSIKTSTEILQSCLQAAGFTTIKVHNAGVPSNTTADALKRIQEEVLVHRPRIVVMQFGINDATVDVWKKPPSTKPRVSLESYAVHFRRLVTLAQNAGADVILMTTNPLRWSPRMRELYGRAPYDPRTEQGFEGPFLLAYNDAVRSLAAELGLPLADVHAAYPDFATRRQTDVAALLTDGVHPGEAGHQLVAELLLPILVKMLGRPMPNKKD